MNGRRAFTLLETMLAALIGTLILGVAMGMFGLLDRSDRRISARFEHAMGLERLRTVVTRTMDTLVMSTEPIPPGFENRSVRGEKSTEPAKPLPPARLLLEPDTAPGVEGVIRRANLRGAGLQAPQRLEVVVQRSPVGPTPALPGQAGRHAIRGVFELRPDQPSARRVAYSSKDTPPGWTLWWRPLPPRAGGGTGEPPPPQPDTDARSLEPGRDPAAVPIISGLAQCKWTVYRKREKLEALSAVWALDLPAYVELAVTTTSGVSAEWMFEVGWSNSPELVEEPPIPEENEEATEEGDGGATFAPTTRNGPEGTTTDPPRRLGTGAGERRRPARR